jgi:perosamine synthetase
MVNFPKPHIPTQPVLSFASFFSRQSTRQHIPSVLDAGNTKFVTSGRVAIALALKLMGISKGDKVMIPAYHCPAMVEPVIWAEAEPVFYKIQSDTSIDLNDVQDKLEKSVKLLIVTHYFGFPQDLIKIRNFCSRNKIYLLEDCAHSFFGEFGGKPLGTYGDYAIASTMKFFPLYEGGCLVSASNRIEQIQLHSAGLGFEFKAALNTLEKGFEYNRMNLLRKLLSIPIWFKDYIWRSVKQKTSKKNSFGPGASDGGFGFESDWLYKRSSFFSRCLTKFASRTRITTRRRENYLILLEALTGLPGCKPLFPDLPAGVVPHVFPLIVDNPHKIFPVLKQNGVPVVRFGEYLWHNIDESVCPVSMSMSRKLLQFPCHQELKPEEREWMIAQIRRTLLQAEAAL